WDQHYVYGRVNLRAALQRLGVPALGIAAKIPPEATLERPAWFQVLDPDQSPTVPIVGTASADRGAGTALTWTLEFGIGIEPTTFTPFASGSSASRVGFDTSATPPRRPGAMLGTLNLAAVMAAFPPATDFSAPPSGVVVQGQANVPSIQFATAAGRIYAYREDGSLLVGFPVSTNTARNVASHLGAPVFASGAIAPPSPTTSARPAIADLDHDGYPEIVYANLEGDVYVFRHDGTAFPGFPVRIDPTF